MAYSLENTADLTNLANAIRTKTGADTGPLTVGDMRDLVEALPETTTPDTQLKRMSWSRTGSVTLGRNLSKSFNISAMNKNKKYPFVFFTKITYGTGYPPHSVFVVHDGRGNTYTYSYTSVDGIRGSVVFNDNNAVLTLRNNTNTSYEMRFTNTVNPASSSEEYAELFYFCPIEESS